MVTCQSSELGWEVTVKLPTDFLSLERGSVIKFLEIFHLLDKMKAYVFLTTIKAYVLLLEN